jgi:Spy/CpxP family protein refolding chaperone
MKTILLNHFSAIPTVLALCLASIPVSAVPIANSSISLNTEQSSTSISRARNFKNKKNVTNWSEKLNLSDSQKQQLENIRQKYKEQLSQQKQLLDRASEDLSKMLSGNDSSSTIRTKHQEIISLRQKLQELRFNSLLEMREVLNPEQRIEFAKLVRSRSQFTQKRFRHSQENNPQ